MVDRHPIPSPGFLPLFVLVCGLLGGIVSANAGEMAEAAADVANTRDRLVDLLAERIAAENAGEPPQDFHLELPKGLAPRGGEDEDRRGLALTIPRRGGAWRPGWGSSPKYNQARHSVDASSVRVAGGQLTGPLVVTIKPDPWVPSDGKARTLTLELAATMADGRVVGTFTAGGDYGTFTGKVAGRAEAVAERRPPARTDLADRPAADAATEAQAAFVGRAYREGRAAIMALRHGVRWADAMASCGLSTPTWPEEAPAAMRSWAGACARLLRTAAERLAEDPRYIVGTMEVEDPGFGPYTGDRPLPVVDGRQRLPADLGEVAGQRWHHAGRWRLLAAFPPDPLKAYDTPFLPELVPADGARYTPDTEALGNGYRGPADGTFGWSRIESRIRHIPPPGHTYSPRRSGKKPRIDKGVHGLTRARWYAATTVEASADVEIWAAVFANDLGKLWVNDRLVWVSRRRISPFALLRIPLRAGTNRLLMTCENQSSESTVALLLSTGSGPLSPDRRRELIAAGRAASLALPDLQVRGRVGDWTSRYPDADPPLAWDLDRGINVRWHTPLPDYSGANPVIADDKLLVNCEPHTLYCLDRHDGEILWRRDNHVFEFVPAEERDAAMRAWARAATVDQSGRVRELDGEIATRQQRKRELEERDALDKATERTLDKEIDALKRQRRDYIQEQTGDYRRWCDKLGVGEPGWSNNYGHTFGAPVSDGEHVWVKYGTGVAACYDLDGNRRWFKHTRLSGGCGNISSPLLLAGNFIVQGTFAGQSRRKHPADDWPPFYEHHLVAFDAETGERVWEHPTWVTGGYGGPTGLVPLRLAADDGVRELILTASGLVYDPVDGRLLTPATGVGPTMWSTDPMVDGNRAYFARGGRITTVEFWLESGHLMYRVADRTDKGVLGWPGFVQYRGRIYANKGKSHGRHSVPWHQAGVLDLASGKNLATIYPVMRHGGLAYTPPAAAGDYAVLTGTGPGPHSWSVPPGESAEIAFVIADADPQVVTTCRLDNEAMTAAPVFAGRRMYLRTYKSASCIEVEGDEGTALVDKVKARKLLFELIPPLPKKKEIRAIAAPADWRPGDDVPVAGMKAQTAPAEWLFAGPLPRQAKDKPDPLADLGGLAAARPTPGDTFTHAGDTHAFAPLDPEHVQANQGMQADMFGRRRYTASAHINLLGPTGGASDNTSYYFTVLHTEKERVVKTSIKGGNLLDIRLSGEPLADGDLLRLAAGHHPLLFSATLARIPPFIRKRGVIASIHFADVQAPKREWREWRETVAPYRARLEHLFEQLPPSSERLRIQRILQILDE